MSERIVTVVVTHNRLALLEECLTAIQMQNFGSNAIFVVNNASSDGTRAYLDRLVDDSAGLVTAIHLSKNTGGAGGFNEGIKHAYRAGADWVWIMDDDCVPKPDCLQKLMAAEGLLRQSGRTTGFLASRVLWVDGTPCLMNLPFQHPFWIEPHSIDRGISRVEGASFVSLLISRAAVKQHGLPVKEFFIWFDDAEYTRRITSTLSGYLVTESVAIHKTTENVIALDFNKLNSQSLWKFKYGVRNQCSYHFETAGTVDGILFICKVFVRLSRARRGWRLRFSIMKACYDGVLFHYRRFIEHL